MCLTKAKSRVDIVELRTWKDRCTADGKQVLLFYSILWQFSEGWKRQHFLIAWALQGLAVPQ